MSKPRFLHKVSLHITLRLDFHGQKVDLKEQTLDIFLVSYDLRKLLMNKKCLISARFSGFTSYYRYI